jgi:hypothetical protein
MTEYEPPEWPQITGGLCGLCQGGGKIVRYVTVPRPPLDWCECPEDIITCPECGGSGYEKPNR